MTTRIEITRIHEGALADQVEPAMRRLGNAVGRRMQRLVPKRTWALHDTITVDTERRGSTIRTIISAGSQDVGYAMYVERGTSKMRAQPYMRPALLQSKAGELNYEGTAPSPHGTVSISTRRQRGRTRKSNG